MLEGPRAMLCLCSGGGSVQRGWPTAVVKLRRNLGGNFVSKCDLDFSLILCLAAGGPHGLGSLR